MPYAAFFFKVTKAAREIKCRGPYSLNIDYEWKVSGKGKLQVPTAIYPA
jgi:hypothetical protein